MWWELIVSSSSGRCLTTAKEFVIFQIILLQAKYKKRINPFAAVMIMHIFYTQGE